MLLDIIFTMFFGIVLLRRKYGVLNFVTITVVCSGVLVLQDTVYLQSQRATVWGEDVVGELEVGLVFDREKAGISQKLIFIVVVSRLCKCLTLILVKRALLMDGVQRKLFMRVKNSEYATDLWKMQ